MIQAQIRSLSDNCLEVKGLTQWDRGQKLEITGLDLPSAVEIHFATQDGEEAKVMVGKTVDGVTTADIPDSLLKQGLLINAYIYLSDSESGETTFTIHMPVRPRPKPNEYMEDPNPDNPFGEVVEQVSDYADRAEQAASEAQEHLNDIEQALSDASDVIEELDQKTTAGSALNTTLGQTIDSATNINGTLSDTINTAGTSNSTLTETITDANEINSQLSQLTDDASELKQNIDQVVQDAITATGNANDARDSALQAAADAEEAAEKANAAAGGDFGQKTITFEEAAVEENIVSGETLSVLFGKIAKWYTERPDALKNPYSLTITLAGEGGVTYNGESAQQLDITAASLGAPLTTDFVEISNEEIEALFDDEEA